MSCGPIRSSGRLPGACSSLFSSPLTLPGVVMTFLVCLPRAPALRQVLVAVLAEGALESPSVLVLAFHSSLFLVGGSSDGSAPGDRFLSPGRMCLIHSVSVEGSHFCAVSPGCWLFFLLWICRFTVGSSGAVPRGNFWGSCEGWVFQFSPWFEFCLTFSLSFPGCSHPGLVVAPSPGFDFSGLVAWSLLAPRSWKPPSQSTPFSRSVAFWRLCGAGYSHPPCFLAYCGALWLLALRSRHCRITAGLASMDRPLLVSSVESQLCGFCSWFYRASWLAQGCIPLLHPFALLLAF